MPTRAPFFLGAGVLLLCVLMSACATSPRKQFANAQDAFISVVTELNKARLAGEISEDTWQSKVKPNINRGAHLLNELNELTASGFEGKSTREKVLEIVAKLRDIKTSLINPSAKLDLEFDIKLKPNPYPQVNIYSIPDPLLIEAAKDHHELRIDS